MKHSLVLKRAWKILWDYKALWIFGILLAITTASGGSQSNYSFDGNESQPSEMEFSSESPVWPQVFDQIEAGLDEAFDEISRMLDETNPDELERKFLTAAIIVTAVLVVLGLIGAVVRYVAETALIRMVDHYEETAEKLKARQGWELGWSHRAWRLFLVDLVVFLPALVVFLVFMILALAPILTIAAGMPARGVLGLVASIGLILLFSLAFLVFIALVSLVKPVVYRKIVLEDEGAIEGIKSGWQTFRKSWKDYGLMWLILTGINIIFPLVLLPFALVSGGIGLLLGGGVAFLTGGEAITSGDPAMVWPIVAGILLFILVLAIPIAFLSGLRETFQSTSWTLTYRELKAAGLLEGGNGGVLLLPEDQPAA